ncbi:MAG: RNA polymerase [Flavobacteriales bacterium CG_4_9_14_3_um_filter_40_17]|nr:MAG: RNA polymerase [Flavobacteriales bacterium CG_4_9_14_3_um_filter_40_17]
MASQHDDNKMVTQSLSGDQRAYASLVNRYQHMVFTLAYSMLRNKEEADEVAQDAFVKTYLSLKQFRGDSKFSSWLYRIAYRTCLDYMRKNAKHRTDSIDDKSIRYMSDKGVDAYREIEQKEHIVRMCIESLPAEESAFVKMFYYDKLSLNEIANIIGINKNNAKVKLYRIRNKLKSMLEEKQLSAD